MSRWLADQASGILASRTSRRGFLARSALVGSALAIAPKEYILKPISAYQAICGCGNMGCDCGAPCCNGYTQFCCSINGGFNSCPSGTFLGGWWKADGSTYCDGPRYYMDCNAYCSCGGGGYGSFCDPSCDGLSCECAGGTCDNMHIGCAQFRYGQCHQEIPTSGRILCRVVSCTPPWEIDDTCTTTLAVDQDTAEQNAPCLQSSPVILVSNVTFPAFASLPNALRHTGPGGSGTGTVPVGAGGTGTGAIPTAEGYWLVKSSGDVYSFGDAVYHGAIGQVNPSIPPGGANSATLSQPIVGIAVTATGNGYWIASGDGGVFAFGDAPFFGSEK